MDPITTKVREMYARFPYPSPQATGRKLKELYNLLKIFEMETGYDFTGKTILDAGTGTGHRLIEAAKAFPNNQFVATDVGPVALSIARQTAAHEGVENIQFRLANLMDDEERLGVFDIVLCMGVVQHLSDPPRGLRNLVRNLADDGIIFVYIYGRHGARERMRRKHIASLLLNDRPDDFDLGIRIVKDLGFDNFDFDYGWNLNFEDDASRDSLIVDAYLNVNDNLYAADEIFNLVRHSGLYGFATYGLALDRQGCLFDTRLQPESRPITEWTDLSSELETPLLRDAYQKLSLADKYRLIDLMYEPAGYTLLGFKENALRHFEADHRIMTNMLKITDLQTAPEVLAKGD